MVLRVRWTACVLALLAVGLLTVGGGGAGAAAGCGGYPSTRDLANPLMLNTSPGTNPLNGASFFVDGPKRGSAAKKIARLLGLHPGRFPITYSWAQFRQRIESGDLSRRLVHHGKLAFKVHQLEKIADQPEEQRFSLYSAGGGRGKVFGQVYKILCDNLQADPGTIPVITTFFLYQAGYCESRTQIVRNRPRFQRQVNEMARGVGNHPAVMLLELDAIGSSKCMQKTGALGQWEKDIRYEIDKVAALPHVVAYIEGGYSDAEGPRYTARVLNAVGASKIRGFFTNDTHENWTIDEIKWGTRVSQLAHGAHFIVNTAQNGNGPKRHKHPGRNGNSDLCNPPGRALGPPPTTHTGYPLVDAFLWTGVPGNSSGHCRGGPASGVFWPRRAIGLAKRAKPRLGPGGPLLPVSY